jgi:hypothetical protein
MVATAALTAVLLMGAEMPTGADEARPASHGFEIGFRTGASFPVGEVQPGVTLSWQRGVQFPLWVDLGFRVGVLMIGTYAQWAPGIPGSQLGCSMPDSSCFVYSWKVGFEMRIHAAGREAKVDPWISLGFGYEWNKNQFKDHGVDGEDTFEGWDLVRVGLGVDFLLTPGLKIGPFVHGTVSEFVKYEPHVGNPGSQWILDKSLHSWITLGVKLTGLL